MDAIVGQDGYTCRVSEGWALAICFREVPEGA
jgi:hypothetical protein